MNYHIFPQNKFFDAYVEDIYRLHQEHNNVFWVRGNQGDSDLFRTQRPVIYIGDDQESIIERIRGLHPEDKLFVSWFDLFIGDCILKSGIPNQLYVFLMGGDFYNDPEGYHNYWLYDHHTKKIVDSCQLPQINFKRRPKNWYKIIREIKEKRNYKKRLVVDFHHKQETVARIDYIVSGANNEAEIKLLGELYPSLRAEYVHGAFDQNFDIAQKLDSKEPYHGDRSLNVLLGNSADPANNHIDACVHLSKKLHIDYQLFCPLSYGDSFYSKTFLDWARKHFRSTIHPVMDYMERNAYIDFLNSMDIVVMYHNRQQAFGNIVSSLTLGKPVFLKKKNPLYSLLKKIGVPSLYDVACLGELDMVEICQSAQQNRDSCKNIIKQYFSEQSRLNDFQRLIML